VHGNASLAKCTANCLSVLEAIGQPAVHVFPGAKHPFCRLPEEAHASDIHGASGLAGTLLLPKPSRSALTHCNAVLEMRDALLAQPRGTAWLVATGPLTNVALLLALWPDVASHLAGLSVMGGAIGGFASVSMGPPYVDAAGVSHPRRGNRTPFAEFNIWADPEAARAVLRHPVLAPKTTLIPLDLTHQVYATPAVQTTLLSGVHGPTKLRVMFHELLNYFARTYNRVFGLDEGPPLHDPVAVAVLLAHYPDPATKVAFNDNGGERWIVDVVLEGEQIGRTVATKSPTGQGVTIPRSLAVDEFWQRLESCMASADEVTGYVKVDGT